jgi:hypothetical protein
MKLVDTVMALIKAQKLLIFKRSREFLVWSPLYITKKRGFYWRGAFTKERLILRILCK